MSLAGSGTHEPPAILVVEDDYGLADIVRRILQQLPCRPAIVGNGEEALEWLREHQANLMLLDYSLPDMQADQLLDALAEQSRTIPFVIATGHGSETIAVRMMKRGARDYLIKGASFLELLAPVVTRVLAEVEREQRLEQAEQALRESEERLRTVIESSQAGIWDWDLVHGTGYWSERVYEMLGLAPDGPPLDPLSAFELLHPQDQASLARQIEQHAFSDQLVRIEVRLRRADGTYVWAGVRGELRRDAAAYPQRVAGTIFDITARKEADEALRKSEELNRRILEAVPAGILQLDANGNILQTNAPAQRFLGYSAEELAGKAVTDFSPYTIRPDGTPRPSEEFAVMKCLASGQPQSAVDVGVRRRDGQIVWGVFSAGPLLDDRGELRGAVAAILDITERKQMEDELRRRELEVRSLAASVPDVIARFDRELRHLYLNRPLEPVITIPAEGFAGRTNQELGMPADLAARWDEQLRSVFQTGQGGWMEFRIPSSDGARYFETRLVPEFDADGQIQSVLSISHETTDRRRTETALRESEERYRQLIEYAPDAIFVVLDSAFVFVNRATVQLLGAHKREQLLGKPVLQFIHPEYRSQVKACARQILEKRDPVPIVEEKFLRLDGTTIDVEVAAIPCTYADRPAAQVIVRDISDRKRAEEESREHQSQLAHVMRLNTMGKTVSELAHEINQPLYAIANYASACREILQAEGPVYPPEIQRWLQQIAEQANRAGSILRRLNEFIRKESPRRQPIPFNELVNGVMSLIEIDARRYGARVRLALGEPSPIVLVDRIQMEQVLINLILNSMEAMQHVEPSLREVTVCSQTTDQHVEVAIADAGDGIPAESFPRLFEPFFTTKPEGIGLGLPISRSMVESHGGRLWAVRNLDRGMTFRFTLPLTSGDVPGDK